MYHSKFKIFIWILVTILTSYGGRSMPSKTRLSRNPPKEAAYVPASYPVEPDVDYESDYVAPQSAYVPSLPSLPGPPPPLPSIPLPSPPEKPTYYAALDEYNPPSSYKPAPKVTYAKPAKASAPKVSKVPVHSVSLPSPPPLPAPPSLSSYASYPRY